MYSYGPDPGSFNPAVITNKEAHIIYGNMNNETGFSQTTGFHTKTSPKKFASSVSLLCWSNVGAILKH